MYIFCFTFSSPLDRTAYLNLTSLLETMDHYGLYYVDAKEAAIVRAVIDTIKNDSGGRYTITDVAYEPPGEAVGLNGMLNIMLACAILSAILNLLITVTFFVTRQKYAAAIRKCYHQIAKKPAVQGAVKHCLECSELHGAWR